MSDLEFLFVLLLAAIGLVRLADAIRVPYPIVLVLAGLGVGSANFLPEVELAPEVVLLVFLPPLLVAAGFRASPQELRAEKRPIAVLALGAVLATMVAVAVVAHALVDGLPWAGAFLLGAIVGPTDPISAMATFTQAHAPERVRLIVEGEAMLNDATALTAFRVALGVATGATFDVAGAAGEFVAGTLGGVAVGLIAGWVVRKVIERQTDPTLTILITLLGGYGGYVLGDELGVSGVLAAVLYGLYLGWHSHTAFDADTRLSSTAFWGVLELALNALLFILLGLQFPVLVDQLGAGLDLGGVALTGLLLSATLIAVRLAVQFVPGVRTGDTWRERVAVGWAGMRGAISLALALSVPLDVPGREEIVVLTFVVIGVTLLGQGLTLPLVIRALGLRGERVWSPEEAIGRLEAAQSALDRLDELEAERDDGELPEPVRRLRELYRARFRMCQAVLTGEGDTRNRMREGRFRYGNLRRELIGVERDALLGLRAEGKLRPDTLRLIERDLDLEEARLSATG